MYAPALSPADRGFRRYARQIYEKFFSDDTFTGIINCFMPQCRFFALGLYPLRRSVLIIRRLLFAVTFLFFLFFAFAGIKAEVYGQCNLLPDGNPILFRRDEVG